MVIFDYNYKGVGDAQRANIHMHVFSKMLYCGKCGMLLTSGLDAARKDGYRPSRYTCSTNKLTENTNSCNNFVSDITLIPFVLNYVSNLIRLQDKVTPKHALKDIERMLLRGSAFVDVLGIDREALQDTRLMFIDGFNEQPYTIESENEASNNTFALDQLKKEKQKFEKALGRLEDLFLFGEEAMSEKDYIFKKRELISKVEKINEGLSNFYQSTNTSGMDKSFLNNAKHFFITQELFHSRDIDYRALLDIVGKELLTDFIQSVISKITVTDKKITSVTFKNGIIHNFAYKPVQERKANNREKFLYQSYEEIVLNHLREHGSANRTEIENLTNMKRSSTLALLHELMEKNLIEKRGNSVARRYYLSEKTT